jgi:endonuclease YncB( thermonuclease family)
MLLVLLVTLAFLGDAWFIVQPCLAADFTGRVVGIIDGDTLEVLHNNRAERIRLSGIDCPKKGTCMVQAPPRPIRNSPVCWPTSLFSCAKE